MLVVMGEGGRAAVRRGVGARGHIADASLTTRQTAGLLVSLLLLLHGRIEVDLMIHPKVLLLLLPTLVPPGLVIATITIAAAAVARQRKHLLPFLRTAATAAAAGLLDRMKVHRAVQRRRR